jgi:hypothetical protein
MTGTRTYPLVGGPLDGTRMAGRWDGIVRVVPRMKFSVAASEDRAPPLEVHRYAPMRVADDREDCGCRLVGYRYMGPVKP